MKKPMSCSPLSLDPEKELPRGWPIIGALASGGRGRSRSSAGGGSRHREATLSRPAVRSNSIRRRCRFAQQSRCNNQPQEEWGSDSASRQLRYRALAPGRL